MKKPTDSQLIDLLAKHLLDIVKRLDTIESKLELSEEIYTILNDFINPKTDYEVITNNEQLVTFTDELYKEICKYCGNRIDLMGVA